MSIFNIFSKDNINEGVKRFRKSENAVLLDVRTKVEYDSGHIEGSRNLPLEEISSGSLNIENKETPLYVHCRSGARSSLAASYLRANGYLNVHDIGGIKSYKGKLVFLAS